MAHLLAVARLWSRSSGPFLAELDQRFRIDPGAEVITHAIALEDTFHALLDLVRRFQPGPLACEGLLEAVEILTCPCETFLAGVTLLEAQERALDPDDGPSLSRRDQLAVHPPQVSGPALHSWIGTIPDLLPWRLVF